MRTALRFMCLSFVLAACAHAPASPPTQPGPSPLPTATEAVDVASPTPEATAALQRGLNLEVTLEPFTEEWFLRPEEEYFDLIHEAGFDFVRLPLRWSEHAGESAPYTVEPEFFANVDRIVDWALARDLAIILDFHHYFEIYSDPQGQKGRFIAIWRQVAEHYKDRPPLVLFELLNEPNDQLDEALWNEYLNEALAVVRQSNPTRDVIIGPVQWNSCDSVPTLDLPDDLRVIVTFHYYEPFDFTHQGSEWQEGSDQWLGTTWEATAEEKAQIGSCFDRVADFATRRGFRVLLGEFGTYEKGDMASRVRWTGFVRAQAEAHGFAWAYWELGSGFGIYDSAAGRWLDELVQALIPDPSRWSRTNPGGGGAFATVGAGPSGILLAASDLSGAYRSMDGGFTWDVIGSFRGLTNTHVSGLGFDPLDADILYLGTEAGIFRSQNAGETFTSVLANGYITDIEFAAGSPGVGYAAFHSQWNIPNGAVYKTTDRGLTWNRIRNPTLPGNLHILKLTVDPGDASVLYLLAGEGRFACGKSALYESRDGGVNWTQLAAGLGQIADMALDPNDPSRLYLTTYGDVWDGGYDCIVDDPAGGVLYRGTFNGGWTWNAVTGGGSLPPGNYLLWLDPDDQRAIRVIDMDWPELWESTDGGAVWNLIGSKDDWSYGWTGVTHAYGMSFNGDALTFGFDPSDPDALFWADGQFVWATRDDGRSFGPLFADEVSPAHWQSRGVDNIVTFDLAFSADSSHIYLAMPDLGCFRSDDYGASWQNCNDPAYVGNWNGNGGNSMTLAADPARPNVVWMTQANEIEGSPHTLLRSDDYGNTWMPADSDLPADGIPSGLTVDAASPADNRTLFITWDGDVHKSENDGATLPSSGQAWTQVFDCDGCRYTAARHYGGEVYVFAGGETGLWRSTNGGANWSEAGLPEMRGRLGRAFWGSDWAGVSAIVLDPANPDWIYAAVFGEGKGLYRSQDRGQTWTKILTDDFLRDAAVSPLDSNVIFAASSSAVYSGGYDPDSHGVLYSADGGQTWTQVNDGLAWPFTNAIEIDPNNPQNVFIGSPGVGYAWRVFPLPPR